MSKKNIVCFGEVLWDLLPTGKIAGGSSYECGSSRQSIGFRGNHD